MLYSELHFVKDNSSPITKYPYVFELDMDTYKNFDDKEYPKDFYPPEKYIYVNKKVEEYICRIYGNLYNDKAAVLKIHENNNIERRMIFFRDKKDALAFKMWWT